MSVPIIDLKKEYTEEECKNINNQFKENMANDILTRIQDLENYKIEATEQDKSLKELNEIGFRNVLEKLESFSTENKEQHTKICAKQDHTNGDVMALKLWRSALIGGMAVIVGCGGFVTTFYFFDRTDQKQKNETVVELKQQVTMMREQLKDLELVK